MPKGIRPTQDKVRKALFDILADVQGLSFLELFAGSGAVGFEALSRGAGELVLAECSRDCILTIKKNIESLNEPSCVVLPFESARVIKLLHEKKRSFDIIFLDPPYYQEKATPRANRNCAGVPLSEATPEPIGRFGVPPSAAKKTLQMLGAYDILAPNGFLIAQHFKKDNLPEHLGDLVLFKQNRYGDTLLSFYRKSQDKDED